MCWWFQGAWGRVRPDQSRSALELIASLDKGWVCISIVMIWYIRLHNYVKAPFWLIDLSSENHGEFTFTFHANWLILKLAIWGPLSHSHYFSIWLIGILRQKKTGKHSIGILLREFLRNPIKTFLRDPLRNLLREFLKGIPWGNPFKDPLTRIY